MTYSRHLLGALAVGSALVAAPVSFAGEPKAAPIAELVKAVDIPYESFQLDNGLTVVVHEDRKAPVVAVSIWYRVGSKHEPAGKTGFAHLFEHLMFNGSENAPNDFFEAMQRAGATDFNGTTWYDRTNYYQTVPKGALDLALFLESDRMGHLLGAVTQEKLDNQRGVVQNEKRQGDNAAYGLMHYEVAETLLPKGHPYRHSTIGSMDDLNGATLDDVKKWFTDNYAPNNAVLVLAGDIDVATARQKVAHWFGAMPRGAEVKRVPVSVPSLPAPVYKEMTDIVPAETVFRNWTAPGLLDAEIAPLTVGLQILGGLSSSRLDNALVRQSPVAVSVASSLESHEDISFVTIQAVAKDGVDAASLGQSLDREVTAFLASGPTQDEVDRAVTSFAAAAIKGLDVVGSDDGKAPALAEGALYADDPGFYVKQLHAFAKVTPDDVKAAMSKWLSRPVFGLTYKPGERTEGGEHRGGASIASSAASAFARGPATYRSPDAAVQAKSSLVDADRSKFPDVQDLTALQFPEIERGKLANGIEVVFARRSSLPVVYASLSFDAGFAADPRGAIGTQSLMLNLMDEGTKTLDSIKFAEAKERLGVGITGDANADETVFSMSALKPNMQASFDLFADYVRNPAFDANELERVRGQLLVSLRDELSNPVTSATRLLFPTIYGKDHPYAVPSSGLGDEKALRGITRQNVSNFHTAWIRPDNARIFIVGDTTLAEVTRALNTSFGKWKVSGGPRPIKNFDVALPDAPSRILFVDRPNAPQSVIVMGRALDLTGPRMPEALEVANSVIGGSFLSRMNMNLRESKGWSYGAQSGILLRKEQIGWFAYAGVQADRTGDSIVEMQKDLHAYLTDQGTGADELGRNVEGNIRELPARFETTARVLQELRGLIKFGRPDDYYEKLPALYRGMTAADVDGAARKYLTSDNLLYVVVGDAKMVKPQLDALDLPVETVALSN